MGGRIGGERDHFGRNPLDRDGFYIGNQQEAYDAELFAIMRSIHHLASRYCSVAILTDSQAMERIQSDAPGPGQDMAMEIIGLASTLYEQGNTPTVK